MKVANVIGQNVCASLLGLHAYTGCDSVSAFSGQGNLTALKLLKENVNYIFKRIGQDLTVSLELLTKLEAYLK